MKKTIAILGSALMLAMSGTALIGCGEEETNNQKTVMNVSLNPAVEFVLDSNDKVISVNAINEEGNLIVSAEKFVGKDAKEAATLFVEISKETGFLVSGNVTSEEEQISFSFSGDAAAADALYGEVKGSVEAYLQSENITVEIEKTAAITEADLEALVKECAPYMDQAEIEALEYMELVETIYESRKETIDMYSQELKNAYYEAKAFAMEQAELETLKEHVTGLSQTLVEGAYQAYAALVEGIEATRLEKLVNEDSNYQVALAEFRAAKVEYLNYRAEVAEMEQDERTETILALLDSYKSVLDLKEQALITAGELANAALDSVKATITAAYEVVVSEIQKASVAINDHLTEISNKQQEAKAQCFADFEKNYAEAKAKAESDWAAMKAELEAKAEEQPAA